MNTSIALQMIQALAPLLLFMLIPVWIPVVGATVGLLRDLAGARRTPVKAATVTAMPRHAAGRDREGLAA